MMVGKLGALALVGVMASGCSLIAAVAGDTGFSPPKKPSCTPVERGAFAAIDTFFAGWAFWASLSKTECQGEGSSDLCLAELEVTVQRLIAAAYTVSAFVGYVQAHKCASSIREYDEWREAEAQIVSPKPTPCDEWIDRMSPKQRSEMAQASLMHCEGAVLSLMPGDSEKFVAAMDQRCRNMRSSGTAGPSTLGEITSSVCLQVLGGFPERHDEAGATP